jgi:hypothetical protein
VPDDLGPAPSADPAPVPRFAARSGEQPAIDDHPVPGTVPSFHAGSGATPAGGDTAAPVGPEDDEDLPAWARAWDDNHSDAPPAGDEPAWWASGPDTGGGRAAPGETNGWNRSDWTDIPASSESPWTDAGSGAAERSAVDPTGAEPVGSDGARPAPSGEVLAVGGDRPSWHNRRRGGR